MNLRILALIAVVVLVGGIWFFKVGKAKLAPEKFETSLKCARAECGEEFTAKLPMGFDKFPVKCPKCGEQTAFVMVTCGQCAAHFAFDPNKAETKCPSCGAPYPY
jgi:DNA-directed RNA polymerase subunit RPC12/RpoP